jgi:hypothetical protein
LLDHYGMLEKEQVAVWKKFMNAHKINAIKSRSDASAEEVKEAEQLMRELAA